MPMSTRAGRPRSRAHGTDPVDTLSIDRTAPTREGSALVIERLKEAISNMDIYRSSGPMMLDERELSDRLGVSRTPIREALAMLQQEGFIQVLPRRGIMVVRRTKRQIIEMIQAWAAL